jgi:hypothetical protein
MHPIGLFLREPTCEKPITPNNTFQQRVWRELRDNRNFCHLLCHLEIKKALIVSALIVT